MRDITNEERAGYAKAAVESYMKETGGGEGGLEANVVDLLADLMHLIEQEGLDWDDIEDQAEDYFSADSAGEA